MNNPIKVLLGVAFWLIASIVVFIPASAYAEPLPQQAVVEVDDLVALVKGYCEQAILIEVNTGQLVIDSSKRYDYEMQGCMDVVWKVALSPILLGGA